MNSPKDAKSYDAIVIGAGVAGAAIVKALKNNGIDNFLVLDQASGPGRGKIGRAHV